MLKSLQLNGFKSFAKKSELEFGSSVSAIVGPNGSGKSNVVEAFRFVLGEQSIKSMRGKSGSDLIFKGSKTIAQLNRAKVTITFDNNTKVFKLSQMEGEQSLNLDFDEIEISREVFADGVNKYSINGTEVRLRDVHELLASVHIGSSGHHIISQGQADRLLSANIKERRSMIEDALGLKVYQIKIKDAEKKLEKTEQNVKEVESLRREIAPHLRYLRKQVEKVKQAENLRTELAGTYREYLAKQNHILTKEYEDLIQDQTNIGDQLLNLDKQLLAFGNQEKFIPDESIRLEIQKREQLIQQKTREKEEITRAVTRLEVMLEMSERQSHTKTESSNISVDRSDFETFVRDMNVFVAQAMKTDSLEDVRTIIVRIKDSLNFIQKYTNSTAQEKPDNSLDIKQLTQELHSLQKNLLEISGILDAEKKRNEELTSALEQSRNDFYISQRERFEIEKKRAMFVSQQELIQERVGRVRESRHLLEEEIREGIVLVGREILSYKDEKILDTHFDKSAVEELRRTIERIKIKLEESGASGGEEALKEYEEVTTRDEFLEKELRDLSGALESLKQLIVDLKITLDDEFQGGIKKINTEFQDFFSVMFGGGNAGLRIVKKQAKKKNVEEEEDALEEKTEEEGVEIEVNLPHKKVRELAMLSGGERSLTSIALLFAMSQVNPPPFLVLDETDAALDEANSRRYGDMIERLSKYSQLIVVTHNRETMSRAKTLYGVTVGSDGASKLLSIKFNDAEQYAK